LAASAARLSSLKEADMMNRFLMVVGYTVKDSFAVCHAARGYRLFTQLCRGLTNRRTAGWQCPGPGGKKILRNKPG